MENNDFPAFPIPYEFMGAGMGIRDYLAAKAMQGFIAADWFSDARNFDLAVSELADESYLVADAMLKARQGASND